MINDTGRRVFLAKMLKIPVALLGLDWHQVSDDPHGENPVSSIAELLEEDAFYAYEDILVMGHAFLLTGGSPSIPSRIDRRLRKLEIIAKNARPDEQEAWQMLLCRFYQLSTRIKQQVLLDEATATKHAQLAIQLARELEDPELLATSYARAAGTYDQQYEATGSDKALEEAQIQIAQARQYLKKLPNSPLKGNIYLRSAQIAAHVAHHDPQLQTQCLKWQESAATILYKGNVELDQSYFRFNLAAVNHEKAKLLLQFGIQDGKIKTDDANAVRNKLRAASSVLPPDLAMWQVYFLETEARLYLAERDVEGCVHTAKSALALARAMHSKTEEESIRNIYVNLAQSEIKSPYIDNLGIELGIFPQ